jgi:hypothetical protein
MRVKQTANSGAACARPYSAFFDGRTARLIASAIVDISALDIHMPVRRRIQLSSAAGRACQILLATTSNSI